ncbi:MAG: DISARM system helicase DrmA [Caldilineaceae bacterium]|nr:DISARM system helicase DrmA [Caldilineaceae bacterium]
MSDSSAIPTNANLRDRLQSIVLADLLGPANGPEEIVDERYLRDRYLIGRLGPQGQRKDGEEIISLEEAEGDLATAGLDGEDGIAETESASALSMQPSSMGLSFVVNGSAAALKLTARWGRYVREKGEGEAFTTKSGEQRRIWRRVPVEAVSESIPLLPGRMTAWVPNPDQPDVRIEGLIRDRNQQWHVTLFLVNGQQEPKTNKDTAWIFQPELIVEDAEGRPIFERRPLGNGDEEREVRSMAMAYRRTLEFAIGHGVGVHADLADEDPTCAMRLSTRVAPLFEVPQTRAFVPAGLTLDMRQLAALPDGGFAEQLMPMVTAYRAWIDALVQSIATPASDLASYGVEAQAAMDECRRTADRIEAGIRLLDADPQAAQAFRFANRAMADQRVHSLYAYAVRQRRETSLAGLEADAGNHSWRTFQLAFLLLNLPALTDPLHAERGEIADLLWFPTGGGKTEAYLGVAAYTLALRRLQGQVGGRSGHAGVAVLMRYTLRLLTLQQFQRATTLICACELIRREDPGTWGSEPFRIGLWVGQNSTPNWNEQAAEAIKQIRSHRYFSGSTPHQLTNCPWCGSPIDPGRHIEVETFQQGRGRTFVYCSDPVGECAFSKRQAPDEGLPILTVDEEIYRRLPALLIATVDKFAQMPWNGRIAMLFGNVDGYCERHGYRSPEVEDTDSHPAKGKLPRARTRETAPLRPPDLIIQDELHLISGPLGTMVGLYETAVDQLSTWEVEGQRVQPKVIASTATIRRAQGQVYNLFARHVKIFPAQGLDADDNFFAHQVPIDEERPGRRYLGIYAPGIRHKAALIRVYTALLSAAQYLYSVESYGNAVDPWMTLVGYFNSLRELGGMKRAVDDSVSSRLRRMDRAGRANLSTRYITPYSVAELTSRRSATEIPAILDQLETEFDLLAEQERRKNPGSTPGKQPIDVLLATNMISVGVDVSRLGLMVVAGQPKNTAEYIQATSRVGRQFPGLVLTVFNWTRPRDISHYERFEHYHATFYQHVEALSVTPFAPRALDRGLSAVLASQVRLLGVDLNANEKAAEFERDHPYVRAAVAQLVDRAVRMDQPNHAQLVSELLDARLGLWASRVAGSTGGARLGYDDKKDGRTVGLLRRPDSQPWTAFTCLNSMRNVEPTVNLVLDEFGMDRPDSQGWQSFSANSVDHSSTPESEERDDE